VNIILGILANRGRSAAYENNCARPFSRHRQVVHAANQPRTGRIARLIRRVLIIAGTPLTTTELIGHIYDRPIKHWMYDGVRKAAKKFCVAVGRRRGTLLAD